MASLYDTQLLYEAVKSLQGITIPHTTGTGFGTDWSVHDAEVEPVVEIFQGLRLSYAQVDAPYAATAREIEEAERRSQSSPIWVNKIGKDQ